MQDGYVWMNGEIIPAEKARVSVNDYGFLYGFGLFETIRAYNGKPFMLEAHLERINGSLRSLGLSFQLEPREIRRAVERLLAESGLSSADSRIRLSITPGEGKPTGDLGSCGEPTIVILASPISPDLDATLALGVKAVVYPHPRSLSGEMARMKLSSYVENLLARRYAREEGAFEAIFLDRSGYVLEGAISNLFMLRGERLITPPVELGLLPGITRSVVIRIARDLGVEVDEEPFRLEELLESNGIFITNSIIGIVPVRELEERMMGIPEIASALREAYRKLTEVSPSSPLQAGSGRG